MPKTRSTKSKSGESVKAARGAAKKERTSVKAGQAAPSPVRETREQELKVSEILPEEIVTAAVVDSSKAILLVEEKQPAPE